MTLAAPSAARRPADQDRRERILAAAERAFAEYGFHATTMQHVADAAGMSAGNLYRTFPSKEAIVEGLCARDQQDRIEIFASFAEEGSVFAAFDAALHDYLASRTREKARLVVEIWAEATRNAAIQAMSRSVDGDVIAKLTHVIGLAKARGEAVDSVDPEAVAQFVFTYVGGLLKRQALEPDFDADFEAARAFALFKSLCSGALSFNEKGASR